MVHANRLLIQANKYAIRRQHRRSCCFVGLVDVRHATSSTFKGIKVGQVPKSRRCSSEPAQLKQTGGLGLSLAECSLRMAEDGP